jgi:hypothetical protein
MEFYFKQKMEFLKNKMCGVHSHKNINDMAKSNGCHAPSDWHDLYAELDKKLDLDVKEATLVQGFVNMVYCHDGFTALTIYKASMKDPDIISYNVAMTDTDNKEEWKKAMAQEIQELEDYGTWGQVPISNAKTRILPLTWVLHHKQSPDGKIKKLKAHICV